MELKRLELSDAPAVFELINTQREYLGEWLPFVDFTHQLSDTESFIQFVSEPDSQEMVFTIRIENKLVGLVSLKDIDKQNCKAEIGYWISEQYQGRGIVTEACKQMLQLGFEELNLNRIQIRVAVQNEKSQRVAERLNMICEGVERQSERHTRDFVDLVVYSLLKSEYNTK